MGGNDIYRYGTYMANIWEIYDECMGSIWEVYGNYMGSIWELYGNYMGTCDILQIPSGKRSHCELERSTIL